MCNKRLVLQGYCLLLNSDCQYFLLPCHHQCKQFITKIPHSQTEMCSVFNSGCQQVWENFGNEKIDFLGCSFCSSYPLEIPENQDIKLYHTVHLNDREHFLISPIPSSYAWQHRWSWHCELRSMLFSVNGRNLPCWNDNPRQNISQRL